MPPITTLFLDIGGVLLTDGWNRRSRRKAAEHFNLDFDEMDERHHLTFDTYEVGKVSLEEYLNRIVFYKERNFTHDDFRAFMFAQSAAFPETIAAIRSLKEKYRLKLAVVSNEGRELTEHRIRTFNLHSFIDFFISSSFVHLRKPDVDIYKAALDMAQVIPDEVIYIEDRPLFVQVANGLGLHGIQHVDLPTTVKVLSEFGLK